MSPVNKLREELKYEIMGISLVAVSILTLIGIINPQVGVAGGLLNSVLMIMAGEGRFLFPILLALFGCKLLYRKNKVRKAVNVYGAVIIAIVALTLLHLPVPRAYIVKAALAGDGGGIIGGVTYFLLLHAFGVIGMYIILATLLLVGMLLLTNQSVVVMLRNVVDKTVSVVKKTIRAVDNFLFTGSEGGQEEQPFIIEGRAVPANPPEDAGEEEEEEECFTVEDAAARDEEREDVPLEKKSNVIYYRPFVNGAINKYQEQDLPPGQEQVGKTRGTSPEKDSFKLPSFSLLAKPVRGKAQKNNKDIAENVKRLEHTLGNFGIWAKVIKVSRGPVITRYEIQPPPGVKVSRIVGLADDMALSMAAPDVRIEAPVPGKAVVGIEIPNKEIATVYLRELVETAEFQQSPSHLTIALGKDVAGNPILDDLARMPHLLIAGATGSGKSVCLNTLIASILFKANPQQVKFLIIDPKMVELAIFNGIPHLVSPVVTEPKKAATSLRWAVKEMEYRYELFARAGVRDISRYNKLMLGQGKAPLPLLVIIIDELADLMMVAPADVEDAICRLAQMARAAGIHLVVATQRPSVDIITGLIKANIPSRISFAVSSQIDSRTILDMGGAEKLLGRGDMLFYPVGATKPIRVQGAYLSDQEVELLVQHWKKQSEPQYEQGFEQEVILAGSAHDMEDELLSQALQVFIEAGHGSISLLQRRLHIGYARAARLMDILEKKGYVGGYEGSKPRTVLITPEEYQRRFNGRSQVQAGNDK